MPFVSPMLASPMPQDFQIKSGEFMAEEKYDGHRLLVEVSDGQSSLFVKKGIHAWSRYGFPRVLPTHILEALAEFPNGLYDGEFLVPGKRSYGVTELTNTDALIYIIFDVINLRGQDTTVLPYVERRRLIETLPSHHVLGPVQNAMSWEINSLEQMESIRDRIWKADGEGLILKRKSGLYRIGKRSKDLIKVKALRSAVLTVIRWQASRGQIDNRGEHAIAICKDDEGFTTAVKTKNNAELKRLDEEEALYGKPPFIGRKLRIDFQERTPDGSYRHPRWDRWESE